MLEHFRRWWHTAAKEATSHRPLDQARLRAFSHEQLSQMDDELRQRIPEYQYRRLGYFQEHEWGLDRLDLVAVFGVAMCKSKRFCDKLRDVLRNEPSLRKALATLNECQEMRAEAVHRRHRQTAQEWAQCDVERALERVCVQHAAAAPAEPISPSAAASSSGGGGGAAVALVTAVLTSSSPPSFSGINGGVDYDTDEPPPPPPSEPDERPPQPPPSDLHESPATPPVPDELSTPEPEPFLSRMAVFTPYPPSRKRSYDPPEQCSPRKQLRGANNFQVVSSAVSSAGFKCVADAEEAILHALDVFTAPDGLLLLRDQDIDVELQGHQRFCAITRPDGHLASFAVACLDLGDGEARLWLSHSESHAYDLIKSLASKLGLEIATLRPRHLSTQQPSSDDPSSLIPAAAAAAANLAGYDPLHTVLDIPWRNAFYIIHELQSGRSAPATHTLSVNDIMRQAARVTGDREVDDEDDELVTFRAACQHLVTLRNNHMDHLSTASSTYKDCAEQTKNILDMIDKTARHRDGLAADLAYARSKLELANSNDSARSRRERATLEQDVADAKSRIDVLSAVPVGLHTALGLAAAHYHRAHNTLETAVCELKVLMD